MINFVISVTSHALYPLPCHKLSHLLGPPFSSSVTYFMDGPLTIKIPKITKEKHVFNFRLSRQKHSKTHVNRLKQPWIQKKSSAGKEREQILAVPLPTSFPGDATDH